MGDRLAILSPSGSITVTRPSRRSSISSCRSLRDPDEFRRFYALFERYGLLINNATKFHAPSRLMQRTQNRQREVGDKLYDYYSDQRNSSHRAPYCQSWQDSRIKRFAPPKNCSTVSSSSPSARTAACCRTSSSSHLEERRAPGSRHQSAVAQFPRHVPCDRQGPPNARFAHRLQRRPLRRRRQNRQTKSRRPMDDDFQRHRRI